MTFRVAIGGFLHESNTFLSAPTTLENFKAASWTEGAALPDRWSGAHHELGGMVDGCREQGLEAVPLLATFAVPSGVVDSATFEAISARMLGLLADAGPLDGLLVALHGATVSSAHPDADGEILRRLREARPGVPLIVTLDLHANVSPRMVEHCDAIICYRTNPHLDQRERGLEAAALMARTLGGDARPVQALAVPPWAIPIGCQHTAEMPARLLRDIAETAAAQPGILSTSVALGFPYADVAEMGVAFLAVADADPALARTVATRMAEQAWAARERFSCRLVPVEEAVSHAAQATRTPVALFDVGDNVGGGSPGDSTILVTELMRQGVSGYAVVLYDPPAVRQCAEAGAGARVRLRVGGATDAMHGAPVDVDGVVRMLWDGVFTEPEVRHGGWGRNDQGLTAVVEVPGGGLFMLTTRRMAPMSLRQLTSAGIDPARLRAIVVKGAIAPRAAYEPVSAEILLVDTPGVTAGDLRRFEYRNRRVPLYPLEPDAAYRPLP